jgi:hypothetical protein
MHSEQEEVFAMRTIFAASVAMSAMAFAVFPQAHADVVVKTPGLAVETPYWRGNHESEWQARRDFHEHEYQQETWVRGHCVRDWSGAEYCRR